MPQLDFYAFESLSIFSTFIILGLIFLISTKYLPKIAEALKLRTKLKQDQFNASTTLKNIEDISTFYIPNTKSISTIKQLYKNES